MSGCDVILDDKHAELTAFAIFISSSSIRAQAFCPITFLTGARGEYFWLQAYCTLSIYLTIWHSASVWTTWCAGSQRGCSCCLWELKSGSLRGEQSALPPYSLKQSQRTVRLTWLSHLVKREREGGLFKYISHDDTCFAAGRKLFLILESTLAVRMHCGSVELCVSLLNAFLDRTKCCDSSESELNFL